MSTDPDTRTPSDPDAAPLVLYTIKEAADLLGLSPKTVRRRIDAGHYPNAHQDPGTDPSHAPWLIPADDLTGDQEARANRAGSDAHTARIVTEANLRAEAAEAAERRARDDADRLAAEVERLGVEVAIARTAERDALSMVEVAEARAEVEQRAAVRLDAERSARVAHLEELTERLRVDLADARRPWWRRRR